MADQAAAAQPVAPAAGTQVAGTGQPVRRNNGGGPKPFAEFYAGLPQSLFIFLLFQAIFYSSPPKSGSTAHVRPAPIPSQAEMATQQPAGGVETQQQAQIEYEKYGRIESHAPMWRTGTRFDLYAYLSTNNRSFEKREVSNNEHDTMIMPGAIKVFNKGPLIWEEKNIFFSTSKENTTRTISLNLTKGDIPQPWQNSSVWLHVYLCRKKSKPFYNLGSHDVAHTMIDLVAYMKRPKAKLVKNLISDLVYGPKLSLCDGFVLTSRMAIPGDISESDKEILAKNAELNVTEDQEDEIIPMWKPEIYIDMVEEDTVFPPQGIPLPLLEHMKFNDKGDRYFPMVYMNEFWLTRSKMIPVNDTLDTLPIEIVFRVENKFKWLMLVQVPAPFIRIPTC